MLKQIAFCVLVLIVSSNAGGGSPPPASSGWSFANDYNGKPAPVWSYGRGVASTSAGQAWIGGNLNSGALSFGVSASNTDVYGAKLTAAGATVCGITFQCVGSSDSGDITGVANDLSDNGVFYGWYQGDLSVAGITLSSPGLHSAFLAKVAPNCTLLWIKSSTNTGNVATGQVVVDASDNIIATGSSIGSLSFGAYSVGSTSSNEAFVVQFTSAGVATNSQVSSGSGAHSVFGVGLDLDSTGELYLTGRATNSTKFGGTTLSSNGANLFVAKLSSSLSWLGAVGGTFNSATSPYAEGFDVAVKNGVVMATGRFQTGTTGSWSLGSTTLASVGFDVFVVSLSTSLSFTGANQAFNTDGRGTALVVDTNNEFWNAGSLNGAFNFSGVTGNSPNYNNYLVKVSSACAFSSLTTSASSTGGSSAPTALASYNGNLYEVGYFSGSVSLGTKGISSTNNALYFGIYHV